MTTMPMPTLSETKSVYAKSHDAAEAKPPPLGLTMDLATLNEDVLERFAAQVPREIARRHAKAEAERFDLLRQRAARLGIPPARLAAAVAGKALGKSRASGVGDGRSVVVPKFRNPATGPCGSGRGTAPPGIEFGDDINPKTGKPWPRAKFRIPPEGAV